MSNMGLEMALQRQSETNRRLEKAFAELIEKNKEKTPSFFINGEEVGGFDPDSCVVRRMV